MSKKKKWLIGIGIFLVVLILAGILLWNYWPRLVAGNLSNGEPWIDSDLKENIKANMTTSPKEDFHLWANHDRLHAMEIPNGYAGYGPFAAVQDETKQKAMALFDDPAIQGLDADLIRALYHAYLDWDARNAAGVEPLRATIEDIRSINSMEELNEFIRDPERSYDVPVLIGFRNRASYNDSSKYITYVSHDGFILQDPAEYAHQTITGVLSKAIGKLEFTHLMKRLGYSGAGEMFKKALDLEAQLAPVCITADEWNSPDIMQRINNEYNMTDAAALAPNYPLEKLLASSGYGAAEKLLIAEPAYLTRLGELYTQANLEAIKSRMVFYYVVGQMSALDRKAFDFELRFDNLISGSHGRLSDEEYAYSTVSACLRDPLERCYLEKYNAAEAKTRITELCYEIMDYYRVMLSQAEWLSKETRLAAIDKLEHITVNVAYPDKWRDDSELDLSGLSYRDCLKKLSLYYTAEDAAKTNQTVDREYWNFNTLETNAYYNPQDNSINIMLGILGGEFYRDDMSDEELLGGIGSVIGHEISHAFDSSGAQYDADGNLHDWWTEKDYDTFTERAARLIAYYDAIRPVGKYHVKGNSVQGEAIADITGIKCMLALAKEKPDFDYAAFFRQYAGIYGNISSLQSEYQSLMYDPHPLDYLRTNVSVQQFDEFMSAFDIQPGDKMYLAPEDRISVW